MGSEGQMLVHVLVTCIKQRIRCVVGHCCSLKLMLVENLRHCIFQIVYTNKVSKIWFNKCCGLVLKNI